MADLLQNYSCATHSQQPGSGAAGRLHSCCRTKPVPGATAVQKVCAATVKQAPWQTGCIGGEMEE